MRGKEQRKKKFRVLSAAIAAALLVSAGSVPALGADKKITIGVRDDIMNFGYKNEITGKYYGMEIDLANKLAEEMGYSEVEFVTVTPDTRKEMLLEGEVDCVIAAYSISESREENFDFSPAYYSDTTKVMVEKSSLFTDLDDLKDKTIGILGGANAGPLLGQALYDAGVITDEVISNSDEKTEYDGATVLKYDSYDKLETALEDGSVDAVCMDGVIANAHMNDEREFLDLSLGEQNYGVATQKDSDLSEPVSEAVQKLLDDGTIEALIDKWD